VNYVLDAGPMIAFLDDEPTVRSCSFDKPSLGICALFLMPRLRLGISWGRGSATLESYIPRQSLETRCHTLLFLRRPCYMTSMNTTVLDRFLRPFTECLTPEVARRIVNLQLDAQSQARLAELATKANEGQLTDDER
jgi:hypothetical protein